MTVGVQQSYFFQSIKGIVFVSVMYVVSIEINFLFLLSPVYSIFSNISIPTKSQLVLQFELSLDEGKSCAVTGMLW